MAQTLYAFLGISQLASEEEIKQAILRQANAQRVSGSVGAYETGLLRSATEMLLIPDRRTEYDRSIEGKKPAVRQEEPDVSWQVDMGVFLLCLPCAFALCLGLFVGFISLPSLALPAIGGVYSLMATVTGLIAAVEVSRNSPNQRGDATGPFIVFLGIALLWPVFYPLYMLGRPKQGFSKAAFSVAIVTVSTMALFVYPYYQAQKTMKEAEAAFLQMQKAAEQRDRDSRPQINPLMENARREAGGYSQN